jgi:hypothetical protein
MAATTEQLSGQAEQMMSSVNYFQVKQSGDAGAYRPARRAKAPAEAKADLERLGGTLAGAGKGRKPDGVRLTLSGGADRLDDEFVKPGR